MQTSQRAEILPLLADLNASNFDAVAARVFQYQKAHNALYAKYLSLLGDKKERPFLPISFFKNHIISSGQWEPETVYKSSGTTGQIPSQHFVRSIDLYLNNARRGFTAVYGDPSEWCFLALLPNYLERGHSSLVAMANHFIHLSPYPESGFFLHDFEKLRNCILSCQSKGCKTILLGVSFALLDFAERFPMDLSGITIMETGGMKGKRREMTRTELHESLQQSFNVDLIHSEYGMTELFSQAYAQGGTIFAPSPSMRVIATEVTDPFCPVAPGRSGVLNFTDLANLDTLSFIQTEDLGRVFEDGSFEVLGRLDAAEMRGCNLLTVDG
jgi:hypothetical protein